MIKIEREREREVGECSRGGADLGKKRSAGKVVKEI